MEDENRSRIVGGVNQSGKQTEPQQQSSNISRQKKSPIVDALMKILSAFAHIVSPIKDNKPPRR